MSKLLANEHIETIEFSEPRTYRKFSRYAPTHFTLTVRGKSNGHFKAFRIYIDYCDNLYIIMGGKELYLANDAVEAVIAANGGAMPMPLDVTYLAPGEAGKRLEMGETHVTVLSVEHIDVVKHDWSGDEINDEMPEHMPIGFVVHVVRGLRGLRSKRRRIYKDTEGYYILANRERLRFDDDAIEYLHTHIKHLQSMPHSKPNSKLTAHNKAIRDMLS